MRLIVINIYREIQKYRLITQKGRTIFFTLLTALNSFIRISQKGDKNVIKKGNGNLFEDWT